jgi:serum/glucocorticoid-regulated kinase 2
MAGGAEAVFARGGLDQVKAQLSDFEIKKMVGKGTFGKVFMVENVNTGNQYAMKCIRKDIILENEQMENIQLEKDILYTINHPFLVNMEFVFQNEFRIYFLMKFVRGGELFRHLVEVRMFPENQAKFFAAQVAMALAHLHSKKIIYRDLKPENVLVNEDGYLLVADFGLAKFVKQGELANSFCGTAEYLAPEMLIGNGHDFTVDWWALGILIFEMIVGIPPFFNRNKHRMYFLIRESPVNFPDPKRHKISVSPEA